MKRLFNTLVVFCVALAVSSNMALAGDFSQNTTNPTITAALGKLESINKREVLNVLAGQNSTGKPIRIMFRNLGVYGYGTCEAVTAKTNNGALVIMISKDHADAPLEALAALIAHESVHHENTETFEEELRAWTMETTTWIALTNQNPSVKASDSKLAKRLNYLARLYAKDGNQTTTIENIIATNSAYQNLKGNPNTIASANRSVAAASSIPSIR